MAISRMTALSVLLLALIAGCDTVEEQTGFGKKAQTGAVLGAATGGVIAAAAGGDAGWIVGGSLLGALGGGFLGDILDDKDKKEAGRSAHDAMHNKGTGESVAWNNPDSGRSGEMRIEEEFTKSDGTRCKKFTEKIILDDEPHTVYGTACQQEDGTWKVVDA